MSRKDAINSLFLKKPTTSERTTVERSVARVRTGAISAMGSSLQEMAEGAKVAAQLQEQLASGELVISLDPSRVDGSTIADRLPTDIDPSFDQLVASILENGQQVPILVRPHPITADRYQIAYGRRRLRAASQLGLQVRAIVQVLTDSQLVVAQGRENLDRSDLSFIEKAFFARHLEEAGFDRVTIISALATDKSDLSRYITIAQKIPEELVAKIGPANKVGRARWTKLADELSNNPKAMDVISGILASTKFCVADSDARFAQIFDFVVQAPSKPTKKLNSWSNPRGERVARIEQSARETTLIFDDKQAPAFGQFIADQLDQLYSQFLKVGKGEGTD